MQDFLVQREFIFPRGVEFFAHIRAERCVHFGRYVFRFQGDVLPEPVGQKAAQQGLTFISKQVMDRERPLIKGIKAEDIPEFIGKHLFERMPFYERADLIVNVDQKSVKEVVGEIRDLL